MRNQVHVIPYVQDEIEKSTNSRIRQAVRIVTQTLELFHAHSNLEQKRILKETTPKFRFWQCKSGQIRLDPLEWLVVHIGLCPIPPYSTSPVQNHPYVTFRLEQVEYMKHCDFESYLQLAHATETFINTNSFSVN